MDAKFKATDRISQPAPSSEQIIEDPLPVAATNLNQEVTTLYESAEPDPAGEIKDESGTIQLQDDAPVR